MIPGSHYTVRRSAPNKVGVSLDSDIEAKSRVPSAFVPLLTLPKARITGWLTLFLHKINISNRVDTFDGCVELIQVPW